MVALKVVDWQGGAAACRWLGLGAGPIRCRFDVKRPSQAAPDVLQKTPTI